MRIPRDQDIDRIEARQGRICSGMGIGVLLLDDEYPGFPGDVRNPSGYPFPIQYEIVEGIDIPALVDAEDKSGCLAPILRAAHRLERIGCRAIVGECGYFAYFQREVAAAVQVPVFISSLLQVPFAQQLIGPDQVVGILMSQAKFLTDRHLASVGVVPGSNYVVGGIMDDGACPEFDHLWTAGLRTDPPSASYWQAEKEFLAAAQRFVDANPNLGAIVLECTGFPPFARALQRQVDLPVFSWGTLLDFAFSVVVHRAYYGHV